VKYDFKYETVLSFRIKKKKKYEMANRSASIARYFYRMAGEIMLYVPGEKKFSSMLVHYKFIVRTLALDYGLCVSARAPTTQVLLFI